MSTADASPGQFDLSTHSRAGYVTNNQSLAFVAAATEAFEAANRMDEFVLEDVWLWPLVRSKLVSARKNHWRPRRGTNKMPPPAAGRVGVARRERGYREALTNSVAQLVGNARQKNGFPPVDVVALTRSRRRKLHGGVWMDTTMDPVGDALERQGALVEYWGWEQEPYNTPTGRPVRIISGLLNARRLGTRFRNRFQGPSAEPGWFSRVRDFASDTFGYEFKWAPIASRFRGIQDMRRVYERLLRRAQPSLLITDCWYGKAMVAASLAGQSLGISVCEVQHGIQEHVHPCFHRWSAVAPEGFLNPFPSILWVWGETTAALYEGHSLANHVLLGGHGFLNQPILEFPRKARPSDDSCLTIGYAVTKFLDRLIPSLKHTITSCPREWTWLLRAHPTDPSAPELLRRLKFDLSDYQIDLERGQNVSMIEFLSMVDVHVAHGSTCALEALAMGMPTLLTTPGGAETYKPWLNDGVMVEAHEPDAFSQAVRKALSIDPAKVKQAASKVFAPPPADDRAARTLLSLVKG